MFCDRTIDQLVLKLVPDVDPGRAEIKTLLMSFVDFITEIPLTQHWGQHLWPRLKPP